MRVDGETVAEIGVGVLALVGVAAGDGDTEADRAARKLAEMRIFSDPEGRMNLDAAAAGAAFLVVSQFTLVGSLDRGRRPSFGGAAAPDVAARQVARLAAGLRDRGFRVEEGRFGASMEVELVNDGPVTFVLDT